MRLRIDCDGESVEVTVVRGPWTPELVDQADRVAARVLPGATLQHQSRGVAMPTGVVRVFNEAGDVVLELCHVFEAERREDKAPAEVAAIVGALQRMAAKDGKSASRKDEQTAVRMLTSREAHYRGTLVTLDIDRFPGADDERFRLVDDTGPSTLVLVGCTLKTMETKSGALQTLLMGPQMPLRTAGLTSTVHLDVSFERCMSYRAWLAEQDPVKLD